MLHFIAFVAIFNILYAVFVPKSYRNGRTITPRMLVLGFAMIVIDITVLALTIAFNV